MSRYIAATRAGIFLVPSLGEAFESWAGSCTVYTYGDFDGHTLAGLVYLDKNLEQAIRNLMDVADRTSKFCWYTADGKLIAESQGAHSVQFQYEFIRQDKKWMLLDRHERIELPSQY